MREPRYREKLQTIKLTLMEERKKRKIRLITTFKFPNEIDNFENEQSIEIEYKDQREVIARISKDSKTRRKKRKLSKKSVRKNMRRNFL